MSGPFKPTPFQARLGELMWQALVTACRNPDGSTSVDPEAVLEVLASIGASVLLAAPEAEAKRMTTWFVTGFPKAVRDRRTIGHVQSGMQ